MRLDGDVVVGPGPDRGMLSQRVYVLSARPGRVEAEIEPPFGRGRGPEFRRDPRFLDLRDEIEDLLSTRPAA